MNCMICYILHSILYTLLYNILYNIRHRALHVVECCNASHLVSNPFSFLVSKGHPPNFVADLGWGSMDLPQVPPTCVRRARANS